MFALIAVFVAGFVLGFVISALGAAAYYSARVDEKVDEALDFEAAWNRGEYSLTPSGLEAVSALPEGWTSFPPPHADPRVN